MNHNSVVQKSSISTHADFINSLQKVIQLFQQTEPYLCTGPQVQVNIFQLFYYSSF